MKYRILLKEKTGEVLLREIKSKHGMDIDGISDLYNLLIENGSCDSEIASKIYYVAYTLALSSIEIIIVRVN